MTTQQTRQAAAAAARLLDLTERPPYTWAGRAWRPASLITPLIPPVMFGFVVMLAHALDWPWYATAPGILIILAAAVASAAGEKYAQSTTAYMFAMGAYWSLWFGWATTDYAWRAAVAANGAQQSPIYWWSGAFYVAGLFLTFCLFPSMRRAQIRHESRQYAMRLHLAPAQLVAGPDQMAGVDADDPRGEQWVGMFARLGKKGLKFCEEVENPAGISVHMRLPVPGLNPDVPAISLGTITAVAFRESIEQLLDLRPGAVRFERYRNPKTRQLSSLDFWMHLDYEDILAQIVRLPEVSDDDLMISINEAFPIGRMADGEVLYLTLREIHAMIVGATRAGKSNLLHIIIYQLTRCYDAAIWMIDLKGGATARPWLMPWVDGKVDRPILDWVAIDRWEAARIMLSVVDIIKDRPGRRRGSKTEPQRADMPMRTLDPATGKRKIATIDRPAIVLITDELAELVGTHTGPTMAGKAEGLTSSTFAGLMTRIATLAAGEAVWGLFAGQRSTADMFGNPSAQKNLGYKIAVGQMSRQDAQMVFDGASLEAVEAVCNLEHKGSIVAYQMGADRTMPTKVYFAGDDDELDAFCYTAAMRHHGIPASVELDKHANRLACEWGFTDRWTDRERYGWLLLGDDELDDEGGTTWEGKPLPLDSTNNPIPMSKWNEQQARLAAMQNRAAGTTVAEGVTLADLENVARQAAGQPPIVPTTTAELDVTGGRGFFPEMAPAPTPGVIKTDPGAVESMHEALAAYLESPTPDAGDTGDDEDQADAPSGLALKVLKVAQIIDSYGRGGVGAAELARDMIAAGLITEKGRKQYRRIVLRAMEEGAVLDPMLRVEQPGGAYGRYYTHRHTIVTR